MRRIDWFEILLLLIVASVSLYAALSDAQNLSMRWFTRDDAYYYFKVAQNVSEGRGFTFDGINPTNGYHPLWLFICIPIFALARFDLILPLRVLFLVMSGLSAATAILLYRTIGRVFVPAVGAVAAIYWAFSHAVLKQVYQQGLETGIAAFFIVLFVHKLLAFEIRWRKEPVSHKHLAALGILALPVIFSRLDLVFLVGMTGIWVVFRKYPMRYLLPLDVVSITVAVLLAVMYRVTFREYYKFADVAAAMIVVSLLVKIPAAYFLGLYRPAIMTAPLRLLKQLTLFVVLTSAIVGVAMILITPLARFDGFPRTTVIYDLIVTFFLFGVTRLGVAGLKARSRNTAEEPTPMRQLSLNWRTWLVDGLSYYGVVFGALGLYMLWNRIAFGTFSPVSGQIKRWWGSLSGNVYGGSASNPLTFFGIDYLGEGNAWHPASTVIGHWAELSYKIGMLDTQRYLILLAVLGLTFYFMLWIDKARAVNAITQLGIVPLFCSAWIQVISYHVTGYSAFKEWYWISQMVTVILILSLALGMAHRIVRNHPASRTALWLVAAVLGIIMSVSYWNYVRQVMPYGKASVDDPYNDIAAFLEEHTEAGSMIGMTGGGNAGYFIADRTVVNMDGLINSYEYFQLLKKKQAGAYLAGIGMDYILANMNLIDQLPYNGQYTPYAERMNLRFGGKDLVRYHPIPRQ